MTIEKRHRDGQARTPVANDIAELRLAFDPSGHSWMDDGRCVRFVLMGGRALWTSDNPKDVEKAKDICMDCPVFSQCQSYAATQRGQLCGVFAGVRYPFRFRSDDIGGKTCSKCWTWKPFFDFYHDKTSKDAHSSTCKTCRKGGDVPRDANGEIVHNTPEEVAEMVRLYVKEGLSSRAVAAQMTARSDRTFTPQNVWEILKRHNIPTKSPANAMKEKARRKREAEQAAIEKAMAEV